MMKRIGINLILLLLCLMAGLASCARNKKLQNQAETMYRKGNYEAAAFYAVESLKLKPDYRKAQITLKETWPKAVLERSERVMLLRERQDDEKWEALLGEYLALEKLNNGIRSLPPLTDPETGLRINFDLRDYSSQISEAKENTAASYYQKGMHQSRMDTSKAGQRIAAEYFKKAMNILPNYLDSAARYETARQNAVTRIAILPFEDKSGTMKRYGSVPDILGDMIISDLMQQGDKLDYTELITRDRIDQVIQEQQLGTSGLIDENSAATIGHLLGAHAILSGNVLQINHESPRTINREQVAKAEIEEEGKDEPIKISCTYTKFTRSCGFQILASYTLLDVSSGKILTHKSFNPSYDWEDSWARIVDGDDRALSAEELELVKKPEPLPPSATNMFNRVLQNLSREIVNHVMGNIR